jgi:hypothetical protein
MSLSITQQPADEPSPTRSRPIWRRVLRVVIFLAAVFCIPLFLADSALQATYFSEIRGYGYLACSILCFLLSTSLVYRIRLENDSDRPGVVLAITSALLVFLAVVAEIQVLISLGGHWK